MKFLTRANVGGCYPLNFHPRFGLADNFKVIAPIVVDGLELIVFLRTEALEYCRLYDQR